MTKITIERETLLPCPFCGGEAEILTIPEDHPDVGAMFVQCCDSRCMTSSALLYPLMDDVRALLVERWNRRAALAAPPAPAAVPPGMALVPIEPTPGIITTGTVALMKASDSDLDATRKEIIATYRAMIAAAGDKP